MKQTVTEKIKDNKCPFCSNESFKKVQESNFLSDIYCSNCNAIFTSLNLNETEKSGNFKYIYMPLTREQQYKTNFTK